MKELPKRQKETYEYIKAFKDSHGYVPSQDEMAVHFMVSQQAMSYIIEKLKQKGFINYIKGKQRTITILK